MVFITCGAILTELNAEPGHYEAEWDYELGGLVVFLDKKCGRQVIELGKCVGGNRAEGKANSKRGRGW